MESNVSDLFPRPIGISEQVQKEQDKWDAWHVNHGTSRTEAKKKYIERLLQTMKKYASGTEEARELVEELEFVWSQVKDNHNDAENKAVKVNDTVVKRQDQIGRKSRRGSRRDLTVLNPSSQERDQDEESEIGEEKWADAPVSQFGELSIPNQVDVPRRVQASDSRWRRRVENAIVKLTAEVAALREIVELRKRGLARPATTVWGLSWDLIRFLAKLIVADVFILWLLVIYFRRKKDKRLEMVLNMLRSSTLKKIMNSNG